MSRGLGQIQQQLLAALQAKGDEMSTFDLAEAVYKIKPNPDYYDISEAQLSSVRRALISLAKKGLVSGQRGYHDGRQRWALLDEHGQRIGKRLDFAEIGAILRGEQ